MEGKINRIADILRRDDGISGAMMHTEQISWTSIDRVCKLVTHCATN